MNGERKLLTIQEAAEMLLYKPGTLRNLAAAGKIPAVKIGKFWRFYEDEIKNFLKECANAHHGGNNAQ